MIHRIVKFAAIGALALGLTAASPAAPPSLDHLTPEDAALLHFEPGEWALSMTSGKYARTMRVCFDAGLTERFIDMDRLIGVVSCDKAIVTRTTDGFTLHSICRAVADQTATTDVVRHVQDTAHFTQHATVAWTVGARPSKTDIRDTRAVRLGACPSGAQPGDMDAPWMDGKLNMNVIMQSAS